MPRTKKTEVQTTAQTNTKAMRDARHSKVVSTRVPIVKEVPVTHSTQFDYREALSNGIMCCLAGIVGDDYKSFYAYKILAFYREHKRYKEFFTFAHSLKTHNLKTHNLKTHKLKRDDFKVEYHTLVDGYNFKNKTIAVDFDGTLCTNKYPDIGLPNVTLIERLIKLKENNTIILWTCRNGNKLNSAVEWCKSHGLEFDYVNENSELTLAKYNYEDSRKITADIYIDDKARTTL